MRHTSRVNSTTSARNLASPIKFLSNITSTARNHSKGSLQRIWSGWDGRIWEFIRRCRHQRLWKSERRAWRTRAFGVKLPKKEQQRKEISKIEIRLAQTDGMVLISRQIILLMICSLLFAIYSEDNLALLPFFVWCGLFLWFLPHWLLKHQYATLADLHS